jgi:hypothetical protein
VRMCVCVMCCACVGRKTLNKKYQKNKENNHTDYRCNNQWKSNKKIMKIIINIIIKIISLISQIFTDLGSILLYGAPLVFSSHSMIPMFLRKKKK